MTQLTDEPEEKPVGNEPEEVSFDDIEYPLTGKSIKYNNLIYLQSLTI